MHLASVFSRFFRKNLIFLFYFLLSASRLKFCAERTISGSPFRWKTGAALSGCPQKAPVIQKPSPSSLRDAPLPKVEVWEANLSVCFADSSPNRGALGRPGKPCCPLGLNWAQGSGPCSHWQRLRDYALPKSAGQAVVNRDSGARLFTNAENFARPARPLPTRQPSYHL